MKNKADDWLASREILSCGQMRALESAAMASGRVSGAELMERAGAAVAGQIRLRWPGHGTVCVLCGPGNNGGDGYVVARHLHEAGWRVRVLGLDNDPPPDAARMRAIWHATGRVDPLTVDWLRRERDDVLVDAIFGTGLTRAPQGGIGELLQALGAPGMGAPGRLVAVDCPSGLCLDSGSMLGWPRGDCGTAPHARLTVTFDSPRRGHVLESGPELCGEIVVEDIGLSPWRGLKPVGAFDDLPARASGPLFCRAESQGTDILAKGTAANKFSHGHALIIAGGAGKSGAARLAARAALRVGAGLVTLAPPSDAMAEYALPPDALMRRPVDTARDLADLLADRRITSVLIGPGCGIERARDLLPAVLEAGRAAVFDADALTALAARGDCFARLGGQHVLTPHFGEFSRLFPDIAQRLTGSRSETERGPLYSRLDATTRAAARAGCTVLLKGPDTVIAGPSGAAHVHASSHEAAAPWLATAGSGDVLAGILAGLMARGTGPGQAARLSAALHAAAGRTAGPGMIADDLPEALPKVFRAMGL